MARVFKRCLLRCGLSTYHVADGAMHDLGNISGPALKALSVQMRLPIVTMRVNHDSIPQPVKRRPANQPFRFDDAQSIPSTWRTDIVGRY